MKSAPTHPGCLLVLLLATVALTGCGGESRNTDQAPPPVLDRALGPEPESLDPHLTRTIQAHHVQRDLFEGLTGFSPDGELVAAAASGWDISADGRVYRFRLRPTARWSNGEPVTAADFVFSFRRLVDPGTAAFYAETLIAVENAPDIIAGDKAPASLGVSSPEPHVLEIRLERPVPYFLSQLGLPSAYPVHAASLETHGDAFARADNLVSNGAYRVTDWQLGAHIDLERNPYYWNNDDTAIDRVRHHVTVQPAAELYRYRAGELDITSTIPAEAYPSLVEERPAELRIAPQLGTYFYGLNLTRPPFAGNLPLRRALSMAIDRDVLTGKVTARGELAAYSWVPPGTANYEPQRFPWADLPADERRARARTLYREAGYGPDNPLEVELRYNTSESHERIAVAVQSMWRDVLGFEATLVNEEFRVLVANVRAMNVTEVFRLSWIGDYNDAHAFLTVFESDNPSNLYGYRNDDYDALMKRASVETDTVARGRLLEEAERLLLSEHPVLPLYFHVSKHLVSPYVGGWQDNVLDFHYSQHLFLRDNNP
ncbi:MAG: peptide ABC transporter substrate-binding protein [Woeseiaceae bacterium]|nr:peptide ABC transporter substrate-binding protein [Woeseiaceae bacterium]